MAAVRVVAVSDVACANTEVAGSAALALELDNDFLLKVKKNIIEEINKQQQMIQLSSSDRIRESLRRLTGKLGARIGRGDERKRIQPGKSHITLQSDDLIDVSAVKEMLEKTEVNTILCALDAT